MLCRIRKWGTYKFADIVGRKSITYCANMEGLVYGGVARCKRSGTNSFLNSSAGTQWNYRHEGKSWVQKVENEWKNLSSLEKEQILEWNKAN